MRRPVLQRHLAAGFALDDEPEVIGLEGESARRALSCEGIGHWRVMRGLHRRAEEFPSPL